MSGFGQYLTVWVISKTFFLWLCNLLDLNDHSLLFYGKDKSCIEPLKLQFL